MIPEGLKEFREAGPISAARMRVVDKNAAALGVTPAQLMESAGKSLAAVALERHPARVLVLCGKGNNGGDGLVAARYLQACAHLSVVYPAEGMSSPESSANLGALRHCAATLHPIRCAADVEALEVTFTNADVIIDAMLGIGASGDLREPLATCVRMANKSLAPIIAADIPTPGIRADRICSFHRPKTDNCQVVDIGIPLAAELYVGPGDLSLLPPKSPHAHKGEGGEVLIIGGGPYQGAPYLAGMAALRAGADLVRIASPAIMPMPDLIVEPLEGGHLGEVHLDKLRPLIKRADVVVIGCGLGRQSHDVVQQIAPLCTKCVFDADSLMRPLPRAVDTIYTPHAAEFKRMFGMALPSDLVDRGRRVLEHAGDATLLVKGPVDVISDGERVRFNAAGTPAMTTGGTGDILAGMTGALFCRLPAFESACIAAWVNGNAGSAVAGEKGDGLIASDLLDKIPAELFG